MLQNQHTASARHSGLYLSDSHWKDKTGLMHGSWFVFDIAG